MRVHRGASGAAGPAAGPEPGHDMAAGTRRRWLLAVVAVAVAGLLAWSIERRTAKLDLGLLAAGLRSTPLSSLAMAFGATTLSYLALIGYDLSGLRYARAKLPLGTVLLGSFCGFAVGNTIGLGAFSGGAVRYRIFTAAGLSPAQIARLVLFISASFGVGLATIAALGLVFDATKVSALLGTSPEPLRWAAAAILMPACVLLVGCALPNARLRAFGIEPPGAALTLSQLALTAVDILAAAAVLWLLLPSTGPGFFAFAAIYAIALGLGVVSHVPGGLGVFEVAILYAVGGRASPGSVGAALVAYRAIYFLLPLLLAALLLAGFELRRLLRPAILGRIADMFREGAPYCLSAAMFVVGAIFVASGAMPTLVERLQLLEIAVPRSAVGVSHFLTSLAGLVLLITARGLWRRLNGAWWVALSVTLLCIPSSLVNGLGVFGPSVPTVLLTGVMLSRRHFRPQGRELSSSHHWSPVRVTAAASAVFAALWIVFFAFTNAASAQELWWQFEFDGHAPGGLRMMLGLCVFATAFGLWQFLRPFPVRPPPPSAADLDRARSIAEGQTRPDALLALMGDKNFLFSASGSSFLMFAVRGRTWASLGDPVGPAAEWPDLVWRFIALTRAHDGRAAFYQIPAASLPLYLDAGLRILKLGEEARVALPSFTLEGARRSELRYALRRGERDGLDVDMVSAEGVAAVIDDLARISDAWLRQHAGGGEKCFSVAAFGADYVRAQPIALLRRDEEPIAFASVMTTRLKDEATLGLMRHAPGRTPACAMEYLLVRLIGFYRDQGYRSFSLGMVPLSGLRTCRPAPRWYRAACIIRSLGGRFYNFQGLRTFKKKFHPVWEPRYLAATGLLGPYIALADIAALIGGGRHAAVIPRSARRLPRPRAAIAAVLALTIGLACPQQPALAYAGGNLGAVRLVSPAGAPRAFVVLFSDAGGWNSATDRIAEGLAGAGAFVVGVDLPQYLRRLDTDARIGCLQAVGTVDYFSRQLQRRQRNGAYLRPIVAGIGEGGTLADALLAQAPANTIAGAITYESAPALRTDAPLCSTPAAKPVSSGGFSYGPWQTLPGFLAAMFETGTDRGGRDDVLALKTAGTTIDIRNLAAGTDPGEAFAAALRERLAKDAAEADKRIITGLPLVELPAPGGQFLAIILSGDGGWRDIDKAIAETLHTDGVNVVGWDSLRYFWSRKSPEQTAHDLAAVIEEYSLHWNAPKVALIGYSFGADVLPLAYNRLPPEAKAKVIQLSLLGISTKAVFEFSFLGWLGDEPNEESVPTLPALGRIKPEMIQCFYGIQDRRDSACPHLASDAKATVVCTAGGHHFGHNYAPIAARIIDGLRRRG